MEVMEASLMTLMRALLTSKILNMMTINENSTKPLQFIEREQTRTTSLRIEKDALTI